MTEEPKDESRNSTTEISLLHDFLADNFLLDLRENKTPARTAIALLERAVNTGFLVRSPLRLISAGGKTNTEGESLL